MNTPLPVEWLSFEASAQNGGTQLSWSTATETNNDYFEILRSIDGEHYETIGKTEANGTTSFEIRYEFFDDSPVEGINYYKIKQVDNDGKYSFTHVESVNIDKRFSIYPQPVNTGSSFIIEGVHDN